MKLSQAILKGCEMVPVQASGVFYDATAKAGCAIGSALVAMHGTCWAKALVRTGETFPVLKLPDPLGYYPTLAERIYYMNDVRCLTREAIAQWLDGLGY